LHNPNRKIIKLWKKLLSSDYYPNIPIKKIKIYKNLNIIFEYQIRKNNMSKKEKKAKDAVAADLSPREKAREAFVKFVKENNLDMKTEPSDKKLAKKWNALKAELEAAKEAEKAAGETKEGKKSSKKEEKPKKEKKAAAPRPSKYEYPADCVSKEEKKKFRAKQRAAEKSSEKKAAKKATKEEKAAPAKKAPKKADKEEVAPAKKAKKASKSED
jgi:hypothetical protein